MGRQRGGRVHTSMFIKQKKCLIFRGSKHFFYIVFSLGLHRGVNIPYSVSSVFKHKTKLALVGGYWLIFIMHGERGKRHFYTRA